MSGMKRSLTAWQKCDPKSMAKQSVSAIEYALEDAKADIHYLAGMIPVLDASILMPEEASEDMISAALKADIENNNCGQPYQVIYKAMVKAHRAKNENKQEKTG